MQIKELPPQEYSEEEQEQEETQEPQPKPKRPPGRPRKPDDQLKRPRPKPKQTVDAKRDVTKQEETTRVPEPEPKPQQTQPESTKNFDMNNDWQMQQQFLRQFGDAQRRYNTQRREKYQALFRNHYP